MLASTDSGRPPWTEPASCPASSTSWSVVKKLRQLYTKVKKTTPMRDEKTPFKERIEKFESRYEKN